MLTNIINKKIIFVNNDKYLSLGYCMNDDKNTYLEISYKGYNKILKLIKEEFVFYNQFLIFEENTLLHIYSLNNEILFSLKNDFILFDDIISKDLIKNYVYDKNDNQTLQNFTFACTMKQYSNNCNCPSTSLHYKTCCNYNPKYQKSFLEDYKIKSNLFFDNEIL